MYLFIFDLSNISYAGSSVLYRLPIIPIFAAPTPFNLFYVDVLPPNWCYHIYFSDSLVFNLQHASSFEFVSTNLRIHVNMLQPRVFLTHGC